MNEECMAERDLIFAAISRERQAQDEEWGGKTHDDSHEPWEWCTYIDKQRKLARDANEPEEYRSRMVKIAALAVAAIESSMRQFPTRPAPEGRETEAR